MIARLIQEVGSGAPQPLISVQDIRDLNRLAALSPALALRQALPLVGAAGQGVRRPAGRRHARSSAERAGVVGRRSSTTSRAARATGGSATSSGHRARRRRSTTTPVGASMPAPAGPSWRSGIAGSTTVPSRIARACASAGVGGGARATSPNCCPTRAASIELPTLARNPPGPSTCTGRASGHSTGATTTRRATTSATAWSDSRRASAPGRSTTALVTCLPGAARPSDPCDGLRPCQGVRRGAVCVGSVSAGDVPRRLSAADRSAPARPHLEARTAMLRSVL